MIAAYANSLDLNDADVAVITNIALLADFAEETRAEMASATDAKRAQMGRLAMAARAHYTRELARFTEHMDKVLNDGNA